jgi:hypothetical protein
VCGQCHGVWQFYGREAEREANARGLPYRPGDDLMKTQFVAQPTAHMDSPTMKEVLAADPGWLTDSFWSDGMIRVSGREYNGLIESPCFKNATDEARTMSCSSCHSMHKTADDPRTIAEWADTHQVAAGMHGNEACRTCHTTIGADVTAHTRHRSDSSGSACYNCHMPYTTYGLLKALRSHQVSSPTVSASIQTGRPNACNLCHLDKTLGWTSDYLDTWYGTPRVALTDDEQTIAASVLWLLRGDAGQRALVAWSMGWPPAQQASRTTWMRPYLSRLADDPYDAVRFIAARSLRSLPAARDGADRTADAALLFDSTGMLRAEVVARLLRQRDNRRVSLRE